MPVHTLEVHIPIHCSMQAFLTTIHACGSVEQAKKTFARYDYGRSEETVRRYLRRFNDMGLNPVTIPDEVGVPWLPNPCR